MVSTPKAPDPKETAAAQAGMNRETAITQQNLNMIDQEGPYGSLTYSQTGSNFAPSETGQDYWRNAAGEYRTGSPAITGYRSESTPAVAGSVKGGDGGWTKPGTAAGTKDVPIYEDGWEQVKGILTPKYKATTTLDPAQQAILDQNNRAGLSLSTLAADRAGFLQNYLGQEMDTSGLPALRGEIGGGYSGDIGGNFRTGYDSGYQTDLGDGFVTSADPNYRTSYAGADDFSADRQRVVDAIKARAQPDQAAQSKALETELIGRGLRPGTPGWNSEMDRQRRGLNDFDLAADLAGGQEQSRLVGLSRDAADFTNSSILNRDNFTNTSTMAKAAFGNDAIASRFAAENGASLAAAGFRNDAALTGANFANTARGQGLQELYAARNQPLQEISALLSGSQVQSPNFLNTPSANVGGVDYAGLVSDKYKADVAASQSAMGGLFGLLSAPFSMFKMSDRRAKADIKRVGALNNGLPVYSFRYHGEDATQIGLMADEVEHIHPEAVAVGADGFKRVRYDLAVEAA